MQAHHVKHRTSHIVRFAIKTVLWMLCRNFDIELADRSRQVEEKLAFTMMPTDLIVRFRRRAVT